MNSSDDIRRRDDTVGVPRRYGLRTLLIVTAAFAALFGALTAMGVQPGAIAAVAGFLFVVGLGQAFLFGGELPREASVGVGVVVTTLAAFLIVFVIGAVDAVIYYFIPVGGVVFGAVLGYAAGVIDAGVFLVLDAVEKWMRSFRPEPRSRQHVGSDPFADRASDVNDESAGGPPRD